MRAAGRAWTFPPFRRVPLPHGRLVVPVRAAVGRPPVLDEFLRGLEGGVDGGSGHAVVPQRPPGQLQKVFQPYSVPCYARSGTVGGQKQRGSNSPALLREPHHIVGGHQVHGALPQAPEDGVEIELTSCTSTVSLRRQYQPGLRVIGNHEARPDDSDRMNCRVSARRPWPGQATSRDHRAGHSAGYRRPATGRRWSCPTPADAPTSAGSDTGFGTGRGREGPCGLRSS
jgi:hypothetical protein